LKGIRGRKFGKTNELLGCNWKFLKKNARLQIKKNFSIEKMANNYFENWIF